MPEPTSTAAVTFAAATAAVPMLTAFGVPLGLRADLLVAGFAGSIVAITLLNTVPAYGDTWRAMVATALRRILVAMASSLTAGYLTPLAMLMASLSDPLVYGSAFAVGGGAQHVLQFAIRRLKGAEIAAKAGESAP